jgi:predicted RNA-binding Zn-ribbon protein involved in translation (DUF1610 family)
MPNLEANPRTTLSLLFEFPPNTDSAAGTDLATESAAALPPPSMKIFVSAVALCSNAGCRFCLELHTDEGDPIKPPLLCPACGAAVISRCGWCRFPILGVTNPSEAICGVCKTDVREAFLRQIPRRDMQKYSRSAKRPRNSKPFVWDVNALRWHYLQLPSKNRGLRRKPRPRIATSP